MIPDWMRCIICYEFARDGKITHKRTCADYRRPDLKKDKTVTVGDLLRLTR